MDKKTIYTMPYETEEDIKKAEELRESLYEKYDSVSVCPNGLYEIEIICKKEN